MFENASCVVGEVASVAAALAAPARAVDDHERIERIKALDGLAAAVAAARAVEITDFTDSQHARQRTAFAGDGTGGPPRSARSVGVAEQVALARGVSPATGARQVSAARTLVRDLPRTHRLLASGRISEWTATLVVTGSKGLDRDMLAVLDAELVTVLPGLGPRAVEAAVRRAAIRLDPESALKRSGLARRERRVWTRPAPDTMAIVSGCVPVEQGVAAYAALDRQARSLRNAGDRRSLDQIRADLFVERLTGQVNADAISFEVGVTMTADSLLDGDDEPADIGGHGPVPADLARDLLTAAACQEPSRDADRVRVFLRRLFTDPIDHTITCIDTRRRRFTGAPARFVHARDGGVCRTPGCEAPIAHLDHIVPRRAGGPTSADNGQGLCEACSYTKEAPGWAHRVTWQLTPEGQIGRVVTVATPTGHTYTSRPPPMPGPGRRLRDRRWLSRSVSAAPRRSRQHRTHSVAEQALASLLTGPQPP